MKISIICTSHRENSESSRVSFLLKKKLKLISKSLDLYLIDLQKLNFPLWNIKKKNNEAEWENWLTISKMLEKQGITFDDSIKRGEHADFKYITLANRLHNDYEKEKIQESLNHTYDIFKTRVVDGRKNLNDIDELDDIALGRIWTGIGAQKVLLADEVGGLNTAIEITKEMLNETGSIMIHEYPKMYNSSMDFSFDSNEVVLFPDLLPEAILKDIDIMEKLPVIYSDDMLMMVPFEINID